MEQCLYSIQRAIKNIEAEICVIDNCSNDDSIAYLQARFAGVHFIANEVNTGFARANNKGLKFCTGDYILFLNPDTLLGEDVLEKSLAIFSTHKNCGALGVQMLDGHGRFLSESKRAIPTAANSFFKLTGLSAIFPNSAVFNGYALGHLNKDEMHPVAALSGAFMMVRKNLLDMTGGFDEDYFMYGEDIDLSYRFMQNGMINFYAGQIKIIHFKGESTNKYTSAYIKRFYGAMQLFVSKHYQQKYNFFQLFFLRTGIFMGAKLHGIKNFLATLFQKQQQVFVPEIFYLYGTLAGTNEAKEILIHAGIQESCIFQGKGYIKEDLQPADRAAIVFCMQDIDLSETIACMQLFSGYKFLWHYAGSGSMVGAGMKEYYV